VLSHAFPALFAPLFHPFNAIKQQRRPLFWLNNRGLAESYSDYKKLLYYLNLKNARTIRVYLVSFAISLA
jgi:hypothetical protein